MKEIKFKRNEVYTGLMINSIIEENYISKQRIKEAILKHTMKNDYKLPISINGHFHVRREDLLKELGIE